MSHIENDAGSDETSTPNQRSKTINRLLEVVTSVALGLGTSSVCILKGDEMSEAISIGTTAALIMFVACTVVDSRAVFVTAITSLSFVYICFFYNETVVVTVILACIVYVVAATLIGKCRR